ncbi:MAG: hypothetical protein U0167_11380 [bacterium]
MGDDEGGLHFGWRPRRISLGDYTLKLDPAFQAEMSALSSAPPSPRLLNLILTPSWNLFDQSYLNRMLASPPPSRPSAPLVPRGAGPDTPRPGEVGDVLKAIWAVPSVQRAANDALGRVSLDMRRGWNMATPAERGLAIGWGVVTAATLSPLLANSNTRMGILKFLEGKDIPVPGVEGLSLRVGPRGGGASFSNFPIRGLSVSGGAQSGAGGLDWDARVMFDVAPYLAPR